MSQTIVKSIDKSAKVQRSGTYGLCQGCFSSGVKLKLTEVKTNEIGQSFLPICERCRNSK